MKSGNGLTKVTLVGPVFPYRGGIANFTTSLAIELRKAGKDVQVISFSRQYPARLYPGKSDKDPSPQREQTQAIYSLDPLYPWTWIKAASQINRFKPNLVIFQWWTTFWSPAFLVLSVLLKWMGIRCVFCIHNVIPHESKWYDRFAARAVLGQAKACITLSPKEAHKLTDLLPSMKVFDARLPVPRIKQALIDMAQARAVAGIAPDQLVLLFLGFVRPYKGLSVLLDALSLLKDEGKCPYLLVAGEFWDDLDQYRQQIDRLGIRDQVRIEPNYLSEDQAEVFFRAADAFVAPYLQGTQSAAIKTAMSYGLPVFASDQIAGDLRTDLYPIRLHQAGNARALADSLKGLTRLQKAGTETNNSPASEGWAELVCLIDKINQEV
jgi:D-inositol-3-phosphate glycosyltransferase